MGRTANFAQGTLGDRTRVSSSLDQDSAIWADKVGRTFRPSSVLNMTTASNNGLSDADSGRRISTGEFLPTSNGSSQETWGKDNALLLDGDPPSGTL
jgi:hypothetical protein